MKLFFDTEFTGLHQKTTLISLGIISEDNKTFYAEFTDYDESQVDTWLQENVINKLKWMQYGKGSSDYRHGSDNNFNNHRGITGSTDFIKRGLLQWLNQWDQVEMWSDCLAYDWVLFNNIFGTAFDIPKNVNYIPRDICTLFDIKGIDPDINRIIFSELINQTQHNSLSDAIVIKACYEKLVNLLPIPEFNDYLVNQITGEVYSKKNKFKKLNSSFSGGYKTVSIYNEIGKFNTNVHRLVMAAYLKTWDWEKPEVNHKDHDRSNNSILNLELSTRKEQMDEITCKAISKARKGIFVLSEEHKMKLLEANLGENNNKSKITTGQVISLWNAYAEYSGLIKSAFVKKWSDKLNISNSQIYRILSGNAWKHVE